MKPFTLSTVVLAASLSGCQSVSHSTSESGYEVTSHVSQGVYQVEYLAAARLADSTQALHLEMVNYCQNGHHNPALKTQWQATMQDWMALQGQERGPVQALEQSWNLQFWPDKKNTTGRKMSALTTSTWTAAEIAQQSVTVQGLGAVEWLLYDASSTLESSQTTCQTAQAITETLANNANTIHQAWKTNPWQALNDEQWLAEYIALLSNQLEFSMKKMTLPLADFGQPRRYFAESWRSQVSMANLYANVEAMHALYLAGGNGLDARLRREGHSELADRVLNQFELISTTWPKDDSLFTLLESKEGYREAYAQYNKLEQLKYLIHDEVAVELGVVIGFNATDGD